MKNQSLVVTLSVGGAVKSRTWSGEKSLTVGHPMRWVLDRTEGGVRIRNIEDSSERELTNAAISAMVDKGEAIELPESSRGKTGYKLKLRPVEYLPAAHSMRHEGGELRIYSLRGLWATGSEAVGDRFDATVEGKRAFTVTRLGTHYSIRAVGDGVVVKSGSKEAPLVRGKSLQFDLPALCGQVVSVGEFQWKLDTMKSTHAPALVEAREEEEISFLRTLKMSMAGMAALLLIAALFPRSEEPLQPQVTRFVLHKQVKGFMTSAAQGDPSARDTSQGTKKTSNPRGSDKPAQGKAVAKKTHATQVRQKQVAAHKAPAHHASKKVAHHAPAPKHVAKAAPKHQAQKVARVVSPKKAAPNRITRGKPVVVAKARVAPPVDLSKTAAGKLLAASSFKNAVSGMMKGGVSNVHVGRGAGTGSELSALSHGSSAMSETEGAARGGAVGARQVEVASIGGGQGLLGGKGVGYGRGSHALVNGQGKSFVSLDTSASDVAEGLTKDQVGAVIHRHMSEIRYCYEAAMIRSPDVEGKLAVKFVIGGAGSVKSSRVAESSVGDSKLDSCVTERLARWGFPKPRGGVDVAVNYPFVFKTLGR